MAHGCFLLGRSHIRQELMTSFHEVLFPLDIALKCGGGPQRRTDVVMLGSGAEERNARWAHSRRRYDAGYGVKTFDALSQVVAFFEDRRGRLYGFRLARPARPFLRRAGRINKADGSDYRNRRWSHGDVSARGHFICPAECLLSGSACDPKQTSAPQCIVHKSPRTEPRSSAAI